ncbi:cupin domain-containing protein [Pokkaliibacter plantistimulans]|nr:cupin domain-containing protein [Pokkaliibacter plantistimulans]
MRIFPSCLLLTLLSGSIPLAYAESMTISPNGSRATVAGSEQFFTGQVMVAPVFAASAPQPVSAGEVTFSPGARSAWHSHPAGQYLLVTHGTGWVQEWGGEKRVIQPGDVVWTPAGVKHWHGATGTTSMTHLAMQPMVDGKAVDWMEQVSDTQYLGQEH